jgi:hypothetical protein
MEGVTNEEEENIILVAKLDIIMLGTITLLEPKILNATIFGAKVGIKDLMFNFPHSKG